jgi:hypothetical protein
MIGDAVQQPFSMVRGRRAALLVFAIFAGIELAVLVGYLVRVGPDRLVQHTVRLALAVLLGWALVRRQAWARWVTLVLLALGLVLSAPALLQLWRNGQTTALAVVGVLWAGYIAVGFLLLSRDLRGYVTSHDQRL